MVRDHFLWGPGSRQHIAGARSLLSFLKGSNNYIILKILSQTWTEAGFFESAVLSSRLRLPRFFPPALAVEGIKSVPSVCVWFRVSVCQRSHG